MSVRYVILKTTISEVALSKEISKILIERKLAACVSIRPNLRSYYFWKNKIVSSDEVELEIKTCSNKIKIIENLIQEKSAYDCPQIIVIPIKYMSNIYQNWFLEQIE